jgi:enoyl-CoA hydratase
MTDSSAGAVDLFIDEQLAVITLRRPEKLNALTPEMLDGLEQAVRRVDADMDVRAVVVASAGDRVFCAGADIARFSVLDGTGMWAHWTRIGHYAFSRLELLRQPSVVAIDGNAFGGGLELALACDLRVVADTATLGLTEVGLGTVPGWGGTQRLPAQIGVTRAKQMVLTGQPISAQTALDWGLVNKVVPAADVYVEALALARAIADRAPLAVQVAKQAIDIARGASAGMPFEGVAAAATAAVSDFSEGLSAFRDKRSPNFTGLARGTSEPKETY